MAPLLRRHRSSPRVITYTLGRSSHDALVAAITRALSDPHQRVVVNVVGFDFFDIDELTALAELPSRFDRLTINGLDRYADQLVGDPPATVDVRSVAERAVTHLDAVTVVTAVVDGSPLDDGAWEQALQLALTAQRAIVAVDLRAVAQLSPAQTLTLAEASAELHRDLRTLILVNAGPETAAQLRTAGLSGGLRMSLEDLI